VPKLRDFIELQVQHSCSTNTALLFINTEDHNTTDFYMNQYVHFFVIFPLCFTIIVKVCSEPVLRPDK
jgi:hypothetical protein